MLNPEVHEVSALHMLSDIVQQLLAAHVIVCAMYRTALDQLYHLINYIVCPVRDCT